MNDTPSILAELETVLADVLQPELRAAGVKRVYLIDSEAHGLEIHASCGGCASAAMAWALQSEIGERWDGPGPAAVIQTANLLDPPVEIAAVACHEAAHWLADGMIGSAQLRPPAMPDFNRAMLIVNLKKNQRPDDYIQSSDGLHGYRFVRAALNVQSRLVNRGWCVPMSDVFHDAATAWAARRALEAAGEFELELPISEILAAPSPPDFAAMFPAEPPIAAVKPPETPRVGGETVTWRGLDTFRTQQNGQDVVEIRT